MKLLLDNNLSHRLVARIADLFPGSCHVMTLGLDEAEDHEIWDYAKEHDFTIITKDSDYDDLSVVKGSPPKVIWLKIGNGRVITVETIIRNNASALRHFIEGEAILLKGKGLLKFLKLLSNRLCLIRYVIYIASVPALLLYQAFETMLRSVQYSQSN